MPDDWTRALQSPQVDEIDVQMVLRLRVPDSHSDCPLGEKYGAAEEVCSQLVREPTVTAAANHTKHTANGRGEICQKSRYHIHFSSVVFWVQFERESTVRFVLLYFRSGCRPDASQAPPPSLKKQTGSYGFIFLRNGQRTKRSVMTFSRASPS